MIKSALLCVLLAAACRQASAPLEADPTSARAQAARELAPEPIELVGVVTSKVSKLITAEVTSTVAAPPIERGQRVTKGTTIVELDRTKLLVAVEAAKARERAARADRGAAGAGAAFAAQKLRAEKRIAIGGGSSRQAVQSVAAEASSSGAQVAAATGRYEQAQTERQMAETALAKATVKSPIDGVVTLIKVSDGSSVQEGQQIAHVFDDRDLLIRFLVPDQYVGAFKKDQPITFTIEGQNLVISAAVTSLEPLYEGGMNVHIAEADIDDSRLTRDQIRVASSGTVRLAGGHP